MSDAAVAAAPARRIRAYTFFDERRPARWWMPTLEQVNHRFAQYLRAALLQYLQPPVAVVPQFSIELVEHHALIDRLPTPSYLTVIRLKPLKGAILLVIDSELVGAIVESRFGGSGRFRVSLPNREFTPIEHHSMQRIVERILEQLVPAWQPVARFEPEVVRVEVRPASATIAESADLIIVSTFDLAFANGGGRLAIAIPALNFEPLHDRLVTTNGDRPAAIREPRWTEALQDGVCCAATTLDVEFGTIELTVRDFLELRPGTVVEIERPEAVTVRSHGVPLFRGGWGRHGKRLAVRVEEWLQPADGALSEAGRDQPRDRA